MQGSVPRHQRRIAFYDESDSEVVFAWFVLIVTDLAKRPDQRRDFDPYVSSVVENPLSNDESRSSHFRGAVLIWTSQLL